MALLPLEIVEQKVFIKHGSALLSVNLSHLLIHCWSGAIILNLRQQISMKSLLHCLPTSRTLWPLDNAIPVHKNWFIHTLPENLLTILHSHFSHSFSSIINSPDENSEWKHNRYPDGFTQGTLACVLCYLLFPYWANLLSRQECR